MSVAINPPLKLLCSRVCLIQHSKSLLVLAEEEVGKMLLFETSTVLSLLFYINGTHLWWNSNVTYH